MCIHVYTCVYMYIHVYTYNDNRRGMESVRGWKAFRGLNATLISTLQVDGSVAAAVVVAFHRRLRPNLQDAEAPVANADAVDAAAEQDPAPASEDAA